MNMAFTAGYLFILQCIFFVDISDAQPTMTASPGEIKLGLTDALDVRCSVSVAGWTNVAALMYLTVSRNKNSQADQSELAIISDYSNGQVNVITTENLTANGHFKSEESASVSLHWDYPTDQQEGTYMCEAVAVDFVGRIVEKTSEVQVLAQSPVLEDWKNKVIQTDRQVKEMELQIQDMKEKINLLQKGQSVLSQHVEFSVGLTTDRQVGGNGRVVYDKVFTNIGDGYDVQTGIFTSPIAGMYVFHWHALTTYNNRIRLQLFHRNNYVASLYANVPQSFGAASNTVILNVTANDQVHIAGQPSGNSSILGRQTEVYATFSGYLLSPSSGSENVMLSRPPL